MTQVLYSKRAEGATERAEGATERAEGAQGKAFTCTKRAKIFD